MRQTPLPAFARLALVVAGFTLAGGIVPTAAEASALIGTIVGTPVAHENSVAVGNRLAMWVDGTYLATDEPVTSEITARVTHVADERYRFRATLSSRVGDQQTLCRPPEAEIPMRAELTREGVLHRFAGDTTVDGCHVAVDLQPTGSVSIRVDGCRKYCVGIGGEAAEEYRSQAVSERYEQTMDEMKRAETKALRQQLERTLPDQRE